MVADARDTEIATNRVLEPVEKLDWNRLIQTHFGAKSIKGVGVWIGAQNQLCRVTRDQAKDYEDQRQHEQQHGNHLNKSSDDIRSHRRSSGFDLSKDPGSYTE